MAIVYEHLRNDTNEVFYVGMSVGKKRAYEKCESKRNPHWHNIVKKAGYTVNIVYKDIEHDEAKQIEILLIEKYGRKDLGLGNLVNMTDGGEGTLGYIYSEETRQKMSKSMKGKPKSEEHKQKMKGKTFSEETRQKMSEVNKGKTLSEETRQKLSEVNKGKTHSEETKYKISKSSKGKPKSEEHIKKMIEAKQRNKEGVKGYSFHKATKKYVAKIGLEGKKINLGSFDTPGEAAEAYQKAKLIYHV